ncbi:unnamed protein product, partial [Mesorhabditis spiculigera]
MSTATLLSTVPEQIGSWAEAVEQDDHEPRDELLKDGIKTVTEMIREDGNNYKVVTQFKVIKKKVPKVVAERKHWKKFGASEHDPAGPHISTTFVAEEVEMQFVRNRAGEQVLDVQEEKQAAKTTAREHCRLCKGHDHWSSHCPYKEMYQTEEDQAAEAADKAAGPGAPGRYLAPGMRGDRVDQRRSDENTCRVTNLPQEIDEQELRAVFQKIGRVQRVFIARDKVHNLPKGFAFVTYEMRQDAERAIKELNGSFFEHMVMRVEWTNPKN